MLSRVAAEAPKADDVPREEETAVDLGGGADQNNDFGGEDGGLLDSTKNEEDQGGEEEGGTNLFGLFEMAENKEVRKKLLRLRCNASRTTFFAENGSSSAFLSAQKGSRNFLYCI